MKSLLMATLMVATTTAFALHQPVLEDGTNVTKTTSVFYKGKLVPAHSIFVLGNDFLIEMPIIAEGKKLHWFLATDCKKKGVGRKRKFHCKGLYKPQR